MSEFAPKKIPAAERKSVIIHHLSKHNPFRSTLIGNHWAPGNVSSRIHEFGIIEFSQATHHEWLARTDTNKVYRVTLDESATKYMVPVYIFRPLTEKKEIERLTHEVARNKIEKR